MGNCFSVQLSCDQWIIRCCACLAGQADYVCKLEGNVKSLQTEKEALVAKKADVETRTESEKTIEMEPLQEVANWLSRVEGLVAEVDGLLETAPQQISKLCLCGCFSTNYKSSYEFGKEVAVKLGEVGVENNKVFHQVVAKASARPVVKRNVGPTVGMESTFDKAWGLLMDEKVDTLGIWGMGGIGKSRLLDLINNKFGEVRHDYFVIHVVVSSNFKIEKVQDDIWKRLGFSINDEGWKSKNHKERAADIFYMMNKKKFVLLLDDVWEQINLADDIGVPKERNGSKVVFTTRDEAICGQMDADKQIKVEALPWKKAWELFQLKVGEDTLDSHADIPSLARIVAEQCAGLPIALVTVGSSMARKRTPEEWNEDIDNLRTSASHLEGMKKALVLLKFSYESLPDDTTRSCFLYCCLVPEDYKIPKRDLVDYWVGEGFCTSPRNGYGYIGTLVRACLLEEVGEHVKLHDVVRDMALWIARECQDENERFLVEAGRKLTEIPEIENWKAKKRISMMDNEIEDLKGAPICPNLQTLFLCLNRCALKESTRGFFQSMDALRVLDLSWNFNFSRRQSLDFSRLMSLHYLNLSNTNIHQLPPEFKMLVNLKCLNLEHNVYLDMIPRGVISSFSRLQVLRLYMCCSHRHRKVDGNSIWSDGNLLVEELQSLKDLNILTVTIRYASSLKTLSPNLSSRIQALSLVHFICSKSVNISEFAFMPQLEELYLRELVAEEVSVDSNCIQKIAANRSFNNLQIVTVADCQNLLDTTWLVLLPNLIKLGVFTCNSMREIINPRKLDDISAVLDQQFQPFAKLEELKLSELSKLESINSSPLPFPSLREIYIYKCPDLKKLPLDSNSARGCNDLVIRGTDEWWTSLEDETTKTLFSSCFRSYI